MSQSNGRSSVVSKVVDAATHAAATVMTSLGGSNLSNSNATTSVAVVAATATGVVLAVQMLTEADPIGRCFLFWRQLGKQEGKLTSSGSVKEGVTDYRDLHFQKSVEDRNAMYQSLVNSYYDLATVFYEWGWGSCFHFANLYTPGLDGSFMESIRRHEYQLAAFLSQRCYGPGHHVLDVGCGIGGPMRHIAKFLCTRVTGITLNPYQVQRGNELNKADPIVEYVVDDAASKATKNPIQARSVQGDFMKMPFEDATFDGAYAIEATCHAPDRIKCYKEVFRVLKPGSVFACYEWCLTDGFDPSNPNHQQIKKNIEEGDGLPDTVHTSVCLQSLKDAGFQVLHEQDIGNMASLVPNGAIKSWQTPLMPSWNPFSQRFQFNCVGGPIVNSAIWLMETLWLAPKGTVETQKMLQRAGFGLRDGANEGIFTAMYLMVGKKPE